MTDAKDERARCPQCHRPLAPNRDRCIWCGAETPQVDEEKFDLTCPICTKRLTEQESDDWTIQLCEACGGVWLTAQMLKRLEQMHEQSAASGISPGLGASRRRELRQHDLRAGIKDNKVVYRSCPKCRRQMARRRYQRVSGVVIDECLGHGVWFDAGELMDVVAFLEAGGLDAARQYDKAYAAGRARFKKDLGFLRRLTGRAYMGF